MGDVVWVPKETKSHSNPAKSAVSSLLFVASGKRWPQLCISGYLRSDGIQLACSEKQAPGMWWEDRGIPPELLDAAVSVLTAIAKEAKEAKHS